MTVPYVFTLDEVLDYFLDVGDEPSAEDVETAAGRLGRNAYPALVSSLRCEGLLRPDVAAIVVPSAWSSVEFPNRALSDDVWRTLFDLAGYTVEGVPGDRPETSLRLWCGAVPECRAGWSWTDDRGAALMVRGAAVLRRSRAGLDRRCRAGPPARADQRTAARESEHVVDARGLLILADSVRTGGVIV